MSNFESSEPRMSPPQPPHGGMMSEWDVCCNKKKRPGFGKQIVMTFVGVLLVYLIFYVGVLTRNGIRQYDFIGAPDQMERTISVAGYGKVSASNDIAVTSIGYSNVDKDVSKAQTKNKQVMDSVYGGLRNLGIEDKDMQTSYSIHPEYNYTSERGSELVGYRVTNSMTVKIRDLSKISGVLNLAGQYGATQVGGLSFTIDDPQNLKNEARLKAVADAQAKAAALSQKLGVRITAVVSYNEYEGASGPMPYAAMMKDIGMGGGGEMMAPAVVSQGTQDVEMYVNITYKIWP